MVTLILGYPNDEHVQHVERHLVSRGCDVVVFDSRQFPEQVRISLNPVRNAGTLRLPCGRELAWSEIQSVYWRNYGGPGRTSLPDAEQAYIAENDSRGLLESFLLRLAARWVNGLDAFRLHQTKPVCLARAAALGANVPQTLLTNDPREAARFASGQRRIIFKPVQGGDHARPLTPQHLTPENLEHLRFAPVTLQEEVPGTNIRVFVAGQRVMACEVATDHLDYRQDARARLTVHALPKEMEALSLRIAREFFLLWTGIDYRLTPHGQYVFLEANPSPMFIGFEAQTGLPLTEALGDLLLGTT